LKLQDWFLPALYQGGADAKLLTEMAPDIAVPAVPRTNLPSQPESSFHGRRRELWEIERWFVGGTRRVVITGFGGQGKTALAEEAGRWLPRTGMFLHACFIGFASFQGCDPVGLAVSTLATVIGQSLLDAAAVTDALTQTPTLLILDNLEALDTEALDELLSAAVAWSEVGASRVLITARTNNLRHAGYPTEGSNRCRYLVLQGLDPDDALDWFQALMRLPPEPQVPLPEREPLKALFAKVGFHPLSVGMLARQLKLRRIAELGERLEALLQSEHGNPLLASLNLSLERLDPGVAQWLSRLGVFHSGAFENVLIAICELDEAQWPLLRRGLEQTGLIQAESVPGVPLPFLRFHPTLAPALSAKLSDDEKTHLGARHRKCYYELLRFLTTEHSKDVTRARAVAWRELPNLLAAAHGALDAGDPQAAGFADMVGRFLGWFGLRRDQAVLTQRAQSAASEVGSNEWYLARSAHGEALFRAGRYREAEALFTGTLCHLGDGPSFERCWTLGQLARCYHEQGQAERAATTCREALDEAAELEKSDEIRRWVSIFQADLGSILTILGRFTEARAAHEASLAMKRTLGDDYGAAMSLGPLGTLALLEGNLSEAELRFRQALETFRRFGEPSTEAAMWHQLGMVYAEARHLEKAEEAYRQAARIMEEIGANAASTFDQLAQLMERAGRADEAEAWYLKALSREIEGGAGAAVTRTNLAYLLAKRPGRLADAKTYAEQALAIKRTLDSAATEIYKTYKILVEIAEQQGDDDAARHYRHHERVSFAAAPQRQQALRLVWRTIAGVVKAVKDPSARPGLEQELAKWVEIGVGDREVTDLVGALRRIIDGERDKDTLCTTLGGANSAMVGAVLRGIEDPATLTEIAPPELISKLSRRV
jgi:tetratricopeptide (TPR) repeat protein